MLQCNMRVASIKCIKMPYPCSLILGLEATVLASQNHIGIEVKSLEVSSTPGGIF